MKNEAIQDEVLSALDLAARLVARRGDSLPADAKTKAEEFARALVSMADKWKSIIAPVLTPPSPKKKSSSVCPTEFQGKSGLLARVGFRYLFDNKLVKAGDIAFLVSQDSASELKTRSYPVLLIWKKGDDSRVFKNGIRRYYKMSPLKNGSIGYLLTSQFYDSSVPPLLDWFSKHGLSRQKVKELIGKAKTK